jgi:antitoxin (DNA-binding transcriptional repressor) of toxin-antitoxin stability system
MSTVKSVAVAEFREKFAEHLMSPDPIAITKHGLTVGYYIPTHHSVSRESEQALEEATKRLATMFAKRGVDPEDLIQEAIALRKRDKAAKRKHYG